MYGNPEELDRLAAALHTQAEGVRDQVRARLAQSEGATWRSAAADAWQERVRQETRQGLATADRMDEAAAALAAHAERCREVLAEIAAVEERVRGWFTDRWRDLQGAGREVAEGADAAVRDLGRGLSQLPPSGDVRWLEVPGLLSRGGPL